MLGVVLNPKALGVRRDPSLQARLQAAVGDDGEVALTLTPDDLTAAIARFHDRGFDPVGICGGDGTGLSTLTALVARYGAERLPRVALLRGGTVNTVARNLGVAGRPEAILARLVRALRAGAALGERAQDTLVVNGRCGFLFAAAMGARFLDTYYQLPTPGPGPAALLAVRIVLSSLRQGALARWLFEPVPLTLLADGQRLAIERARLLVASTVPDVGIGMRLAWRAGAEAGRFHVVASGLPIPSLALQLPRVLGGRPLRGGPHLDLTARSLEVRFDRPQRFTVDGDLFEGERVQIEIGPRLRVVSA